MKVFWNTKDWHQKPASFFLEQFLLERWVTLMMLHSWLDFPENEEDSRKLKKVEEIVQHK